MAEISPYQRGNKKEEVSEMFDNIAHSYDFLNHFFSLGIDVMWRRKALRILKKENPKIILDVATGTGDFALEIIRMKLEPEKIIGVDISEGMLNVGRQKIAKRNLDKVIELQKADSENLPFENEKFDAFTVAFGVRNFANLENGLREMLRVLKPGSMGVILEFSKPRYFPMKQLFSFYFRGVMPLLGKFVSKDHRAYTYLPESVAHFPDGDDFRSIMEKTGYRDCQFKRLSGGIATIYTGRK